MVAKVDRQHNVIIAFESPSSIPRGYMPQIIQECFSALVDSEIGHAHVQICQHLWLLNDIELSSILRVSRSWVLLLLLSLLRIVSFGQGLEGHLTQEVGCNLFVQAPVQRVANDPGAWPERSLASMM